MSRIFDKPKPEQVKQWYGWVFGLRPGESGQNPFNPGNQSWEFNENLIWLAGVTCTTPAAHASCNTASLNEILAQAPDYNVGTGKSTKALAAKNKRTIYINKDDKRDLYIPVSTELATAKKYPNLNLGQVARKIIDRDNDADGNPPAFVKFKDDKGKETSINRNQLKAYRVHGRFEQLSVPNNNVFMLPDGEGPAAFNDYAAILKNNALTREDTNTLSFGFKGKKFSYQVEYKIKCK